MSTRSTISILKKDGSVISSYCQPDGYISYKGLIMSTRSTISILKKDGSVISAYCHSDGYISYNGAILFLYYDKKEKVNELLSFGQMSSLDKDVKTTVFYGRDRGENSTEAIEYKNYKEFFNDGDFQEYDYIFNEEKEKWYLIDLEKNKLKPLGLLVKKEKENLNNNLKNDLNYYLVTKSHNKLQKELQKELKKTSIKQIKIKI